MKIQEVQPPTPIPHLEVVDKLWKLPMMEFAWNTSFDMYGRVKASHDLVNWTFSTAEGAMQKAFYGGIAPVAMKFEEPIHKVDEKLCQGLNKLEEMVPIVRQPPSEVYENAKNYVTAKIQPTVQTVQGSFLFQEAKKFNVKSLKDLSWAKANDILSSPYGHIALVGLDATTGAAERCLDYYLPAAEAEQDDSNNLHVHPSVECDDKVMHAVHTVGILSNKVSRRLYYIVRYQISQINKQNINEYLSSLALVMQLTNFLNSVNRNVTNQPNVIQEENTQEQQQ